MWTRKTAKEVGLPTLPIGTSNLSPAKLPLEGLIMLSRPPNLSTASSPILSAPKQSGMCSRKTIFALLSRRNVLYSRSDIDKTVSNLPNIMKIGQ